MTCKPESIARGGLMDDQRGLSTVEYALLFVLIVAATAGLWSKFGHALEAAVLESTGEYSTAIGQPLAP